MHAKLITAIAISSMLACPVVHASRIDADEVITSGVPTSETVYHQSIEHDVFEFSPFTGQTKQPVPGFSDPLGLGTDPSFKVFSGSVAHMDILGDLHPVDTDETQVSIVGEQSPAAELINQILYERNIPTRKKLVAKQLNLARSKLSDASTQPRTTEASPLVLTSFGSISEYAVPIRMHWTKCPNYSFQRYLHKRTKKLPQAVTRDQKPSRDCFVL